MVFLHAISKRKYSKVKQVFGQQWKKNLRLFLGIKTMLKGHKFFIMNSETEINKEIWYFYKYIVFIYK